ncbi:glycosyl transferase [Actinoplanes siamensis]|uniref:Glycosyl transferase n=2 Tax=Actinoplanes siamensis TaxID=1223317 RepID=A0A919N9T5_9ACTN|nr:glycosyl transferase [Actinoplanes siamensis]
MYAMRLLFTTWAWPSHLYAMVPLAWACRAAGHDVVVASQPALRQAIESTGLTAVEVGTDVDAAGMVRGYVLPAEAAGGAGLGTAPRTGGGPRALAMVLANAMSMADGLLDFAKQWRPDVVVYDPTAMAGPVVAAAAGVPAVRHLYGTDLMQRARRALPELLAPLAARHGVTSFDPYGTVTVDPWPESMQLPGVAGRIGMGYVPFNGPGRMPAALPDRSRRPRVLVTWGHTIGRVAPERFPVAEVTAALARDASVVVAVSHRQQHLLLEKLPDGVTVLVDAPLHHLAGECDLVVSHGGAGTVLTALHAGTPLLLVPQLPDHAGHAARVLARGVGQVLTYDEMTGDRLRAEAAALLSGDAGTAAAQVRAEMLEEKPPAAIAAGLPDLLA